MAAPETTAKDMIAMLKASLKTAVADEKAAIAKVVELETTLRVVSSSVSRMEATDA